MHANQREVVAQWIQARAAERDAPALLWALEAVVQGLLQCYPAETGPDAVWGVIRRLLGPERRDPES